MWRTNNYQIFRCFKFAFNMLADYFFNYSSILFYWISQYCYSQITNIPKDRIQHHIFIYFFSRNRRQFIMFKLVLQFFRYFFILMIIAYKRVILIIFFLSHNTLHSHQSYLSIDMPYLRILSRTVFNSSLSVTNLNSQEHPLIASFFSINSTSFVLNSFT